MNARLENALAILQRIEDELAYPIETLIQLNQLRINMNELLLELRTEIEAITFLLEDI